MVTGFVNIIMMTIYQFADGCPRLDFERQAQPWHKVWAQKRPTGNRAGEQGLGSRLPGFKARLQHF